MLKQSLLQKINIACAMALLFYGAMHYVRQKPDAYVLMTTFHHMDCVYHAKDYVTLTSSDDREIYECVENVYPHLKAFKIYKHRGCVKAHLWFK